MVWNLRDIFFFSFLDMPSVIVNEERTPGVFIRQSKNYKFLIPEQYDRITNFRMFKQHDQVITVNNFQTFEQRDQVIHVTTHKRSYCVHRRYLTRPIKFEKKGKKKKKD